jgi:hypothetical protein
MVTVSLMLAVLTLIIPYDLAPSVFGTRSYGIPMLFHDSTLFTTHILHNTQHYTLQTRLPYHQNILPREEFYSSGQGPPIYRLRAVYGARRLCPIHFPRCGLAAWRPD